MPNSPPPQGGSVLDIFKAITNEPLDLPEGVLVSPNLRDLFGRLFDKDPATRITVSGCVFSWAACDVCCSAGRLTARAGCLPCSLQCNAHCSLLFKTRRSLRS